MSSSSCSIRAVNPTSNTSGKYSTSRSEEHTSELQSQSNLVCRLLLEKKNIADVSIAADYGRMHLGGREPEAARTWTLAAVPCARRGSWRRQDHGATCPWQSAWIVRSD